jgi:hypothetical protein
MSGEAALRAISPQAAISAQADNRWLAGPAGLVENGPWENGEVFRGNSDKVPAYGQASASFDGFGQRHR